MHTNRIEPTGARHSEGRGPSKLGLLVAFLMTRKKWWLAPIVVFLVFVSFLIMVTQSSALAPLLYPLF